MTESIGPIGLGWADKGFAFAEPVNSGGRCYTNYRSLLGPPNFRGRVVPRAPAHRPR